MELLITLKVCRLLKDAMAEYTSLSIVEECKNDGKDIKFPPALVFVGNCVAQNPFPP